MADELDAFGTALATVLESGLTGIKEAHEHPLEGLNEFPVAVIYFVNGRFWYGAGSPTVGVHQVQADVHLGRSVLPEDSATARPYILLALATIADNMKMSGTCEHCLLERYEIGGMQYADKETFGVRLFLEVKILHGGISVSV